MKRMIVLLSCLTFASAAAITFEDVVMEEWTMYKLEHNKTYKDSTEEMFRMKIFLENKHKIAKHNQMYQKGFHSYKLGLNKYADLLHHEFVKIMNGFHRSYFQQKLQGSTFLPPSNVAIPKSVDWRNEGYVTPIKDQGSCGSCWAFSATGGLEGQHYRKTGTLVSLSEQNLIDCSKKYGNEGCNGGLMDQAFQYVKDNNGIDTEKSYPYEAQDDMCRFNPMHVGARDTGFVDLPHGDEQQLKVAVATVGPISVAIDASHESFQFYHSGVYNEPECDNENLDHGVLVVGYGVDKTGLDYWLVKNSWGTTWGDMGYVKMARNKDNQCGISTQASYPLV